MRWAILLYSNRVLDFGQYLAGLLVGMMLADMGAEVIRIDPPGGPHFKSPAIDMLSRGKPSLVLDLKTESRRNTALELCCRSNVLIENFRPGVMKRLGLGPHDLRAVNPGIISLSLPGFASTDAKLAGLAVWEAIIAARTGRFTDMGLNRRLMGLPISSSRAEGSVDDIANARMGMRRRMRGSPKGAYRVAVTRAAVLDSRLIVENSKRAA